MTGASRSMPSSGRPRHRTSSGSPRTSTARARPSPGMSPRRPGCPPRKRARGGGATAAAALRGARVGTRKQQRSPAPPFTTSTLQQEASRKLGFSPKRTMSVAQRLYEGADTPDGHVGLITYMRTDSTAIAGVAMGEAREVISGRYGAEYSMPKGRGYQTKAKGAQGGPEA